MAKIDFERLVSRNVANFVGSELKLAGVKIDTERFLRLTIIGCIALFVVVPFILFFELKYGFGIAILGAFGSAALLIVCVYALLEFQIEQRKTFVESVLPDYLQLAAANVRSGIALDKAMVLAARPEFGYFTEDLRGINKELYAGVSLQNTLQNLGKYYRSSQLQHTIRMMIEGIQYGGGMTDLLNQIAKDMRNQQMVQKEIAGQLFMYTIFIAFAALIGAPTLYALTTQMITITNTVSAGIAKNSGGTMPTQGTSFFKFSAPQISTNDYRTFALVAVAIITGFGAFIVSVISTGSALKGIRYLPIFLLVGLGIFYVVGAIIGGMFSSISGI